MSEQLPDSDRGLPRVIIAQRVIDKMVRGALLYPGYETGEAMVGLIVPQEERLEPDIYILDTIGPGEDAVRQWGMFEHGDDWLGEVGGWLSANWNAFRDLRRPSYGRALAAKWDVPLRFVGDWHKQPGAMIAPSPMDADTARDIISDPETPDMQLVAPIVTMYRVRNGDEDDTHEPSEVSRVADAETGAVAENDTKPETTTEANAETGETAAAELDDKTEQSAPPDPETLPGNALIRSSRDEEWLIRIDFWYMSKRLMRGFAPITPTIWPDDRLPSLPPVAWHLLHPRRFDQELQLLADAGYVVDSVRWDADGKPPYEICFSIYKLNTQHVFILVTPVDYPAEMPAMRIAPLVRVAEDESVFEKLYEASQPLLLTKQPDWTWDSKRTLIELVWHIEKTLEKGSEA